MPREMNNKEKSSIQQDKMSNDLPGTSDSARNPNPAANENVDEQPTSAPDKRSDRIGDEITDGEDA